ncbi:MAG: phospholipase D-like domain-containing protein [Bdellovibrionota bacterium]
MRLVFAISLISALASPAFASTEVQVSEAPTNNLTMTVDAIKSAQHSLFLNIYDLSSPEVADALLDRIQNGIQVQILEEGEPFGRMSAAAHGIQLQLARAMRSARNANDHFFMMTGQGGKVKRRFHYDHAKYTVIDGQRLLIGSENYSPTGNPKPGTTGNRGWEVLIHDPVLSAKFLSVFKSDTNLSHGDVQDLTKSAQLDELAEEPNPKATAPSTGGGLWNGLPTLQADSAQMITSPDTSLSGLTAAIRSARRSIDVQQMEFATKWGLGGGTSPLLTELIAAAKRGVRVRVLVNDERVFDTCNHPPHLTNVNTAALLNKTASSGHLPLQARVANVQGMGVDYIHNKGVLVDDDRTLVSSINWTENAVEKNREAAVLLQSTEISAHYKALFNSDWNVSARPGAAPNHHCGGMALEAVSDELVEPLMDDQPNDPAESDEPELDPDLSFCPAHLSMVAHIGNLNLDQPNDQSFRAIENQTISGLFSRVEDQDSCVLSDQNASNGIGPLANHRFIEIHTRRDGTKVISLEGYTPANKLYSIRASASPEEKITGVHRASVLDASGPGRHRLGAAELELE